MRRLLATSVVGLFSFVATASAQAVLTPGQAPVRRQPLVAVRPELLRPIGSPHVDTVPVRPDSAAPAERAAPATATAAQARSVRVCPMPVARGDTARKLERMPVGRDSTRAAPMPVAPPGCENPRFR